MLDLNTSVLTPNMTFHCCSLIEYSNKTLQYCKYVNVNKCGAVCVEQTQLLDAVSLIDIYIEHVLY